MFSNELVYECVYSSAAVIRTGHVRAWDAEEAAELFARELQGEGVVERGEIRAREMRGRQASRRAYVARKTG